MNDGRRDAADPCRDLLEEKNALLARVAALEEERRRLVEEKSDLERRLSEEEGEKRRFAELFIGAERQSASLASLYVAIHQLHGTLDRGELLRVLREILADVVGCEEFAIFELDEAGPALRLLTSAGIDDAAFARLAPGQGLIGQVAASGESWLAGQRAAEGAETGLTACLPLRLADRVTGALALFRLLPQKNGLEQVDHEVLDLLANHVAMALYCSALHQRTKALA